MEFNTIKSAPFGQTMFGTFFPTSEEYEHLRKRGAADNIDEGKTMDSWVDQMTLIFVWRMMRIGDILKG